MPLSFQAIAERQIALLQEVCETHAARARAGRREDLESLFLAQDHLEHWLQYLSPLATTDRTASVLEAPPPLPSMRPAPPLGRDSWEADEVPQQTHVTFPPEPLWAADLESASEEGP